MSLEISIHKAQTSILRELLFRPEAGYTELQKPTALTSDHFNFHIKRLAELGLVQKTASGHYRLTTRGKEYANKLDTDSNTIERQPKVSVIMVIWRDHSHHEFLLQERLKNPYFGFWGYPTGKMRWGETVLAAAERELQEETGLSGGFEFHGIYHEHACSSTGRELLEDKLFLVTSVTAPTGTLRDEVGCHNEWVDLKRARQFEKTFPGFGTVQDIISGVTVLAEHQRQYRDDQF